MNRTRRSCLLIVVFSTSFLFGCPWDQKAAVNNPVQNKPSSAPVITTPTSNPISTNNDLEIHGTCTDGFQVYLSGDDNQSIFCHQSLFTFTIQKNTDGTYYFMIYQTKASEKQVSSSVLIQWIRDSVPPAAPTITSPAETPYYSATTITLSGTCIAGHTVNLTGDSRQTTPCSTSDSYSFLVSKDTDGIYSFEVSQVNLLGTPSPTINNPSFQWIRDSSIPSTNFTSTPSSVNLSSSASFSFSSTEPGSFLCKLDAGADTPCTSPHILASLTNGTHTLSVASVDLAGNIDPSPPIYTWTQAVYNTVALYHFDSSTGLTADSSNYSGSYKNSLTNHNSATSGEKAKFYQSVNLASASSQFLSAPHNATQELLQERMTVEGFVKLTSTPTAGSKYVIASKTASAGQYGWEFGLTQTGSNSSLYFTGSLDGTHTATLNSAPFNPGTSTFRHYAVTWNQGVVQFFYNGSVKGLGAIGSGTVALFGSTADLKIGAHHTGDYLNGILDEVRVSNKIRFSGPFTAPSLAYTAD